MKRIDWSQMIHDQEKSKMSIAEFCRSVGISARQFYYHHERSKTKENNTKSGFVKVDVIAPEPKTKGRSGFIIQLLSNGKVKTDGDPLALLNFLGRRDLL